MDDPRERLRRYLEQRREMGERELLLDDMSVDEVMRLLGASKTRAKVAVERERAPRRVVDESASQMRTREAPADFGGDWREALKAAGAESPTVKPPAEKSPMVPPLPSSSSPSSPGSSSSSSSPGSSGSSSSSSSSGSPGSPSAPGLIVGSADRDLFTGPFSHLETLGQLARTVEGCTRCPLYETAKNAVPGEGNPNADLVCVGEAPGATEDELGRPFVGQAGKLLEKILLAINLAREDVFICNVLKHRPPGNRNPFPKEVEACSPYLVRQLELIRPKAILALGTFAAQTLLNTKLSIGKLRGAVHKYHGIPLIVTYHPAALLRNPAWKRPTWEDVQHVRRILDSAPSAP